MSEHLLPEVIDLDKVEPNVYNPNKMDKAKFESLKINIEKFGFFMPIIVRANEEKTGFYTIIDGEHRWRALCEVGKFETIPAYKVVTKEDEAKAKTLSMNHLRGEMENIGVANIVAELLQTMSIQEVEEWTGYTEQEVINYRELIEFDFDKYEKLDVGDDADLSEAMGDDAQMSDTPVKTLTILLSQSQADLYDRAKKFLPNGTSKDDDQVCFIAILKRFAEVYGEDSSEVEDIITKIDKPEEEKIGGVEEPLVDKNLGVGGVDLTV